MPEMSHSNWPKTCKMGDQMAETGDVTLPNGQSDKFRGRPPMNDLKTRSHGCRREAIIGAVVMTIILVSSAVAVGVSLAQQNKPVPRTYKFTFLFSFTETFKNVLRRLLFCRVRWIF